jgi:hypothetical protein
MPYAYKRLWRIFDGLRQLPGRGLQATCQSLLMNIHDLLWWIGKSDDLTFYCNFL